MKGVQNPLRGLFCRYFLLKMIKDKFPDKGNEYEKPGASFEDTIKFILSNLEDMNQLWIRLSVGSIGVNRLTKENEREELKTLVGENITRLASLNGITAEIYQKEVMPKIVEILMECNDPLSQHYIMECLIHAFPDEYNIQCMNSLLETCTKLQQNVDVKSLFIALMEKLARFVETNQSSKDSKDNETVSNIIQQAEKIFDILKSNIDKLVSDSLGMSNVISSMNTSMDLNKLIELEAAFLKFTIKCCPEKQKLITINYILGKCVALLSKNKSEKVNSEGIKLIGRLLSTALESPLSIFEMPNFPELMRYLDYASRATLSLRIIDSLVIGLSKVKIDSSEKMSTLLDFIRPLLEDSPDAGEFDQYQFEYEQSSVCKLLFIISADEPHRMYEILSVLKNVFIKGGSKRLKYTVPSLISAYLSLAYGVAYAVAKNNKVLDTSRDTIQIHDDFISHYKTNNIDTNNLYIQFLNRIYNQINDTLSLIQIDYPE